MTPIADSRQLAPALAPALAPESVAPAFAAALSRGHLQAAAAYFARDACLLTADATEVRGRADIRLLLGQMIGSGIEVAVEQRGICLAGEVALLLLRWTTRFAPAGGTPYARTSQSTNVVHRVESTWKLQIAAPWA